MAEYHRLVIRKCLTFLTFLAGHTCYGQQEGSSLEFALTPALGFNVSFSTFQKGYDKEYNSIEGNSSKKSLYYGLGLQLVYSEDLQLNIRYAGCGMGGGYATKDLYYSTGGSTQAYSRISSQVNMFDASIEKNLLQARFFNNRPFYAKCNFSGSLGFRYISIVAPNRTDSLWPLKSSSSNLIQEISYGKQFRNGGVALSGGIGAQLFIKEHRSLKIGVTYYCLLRPIFEYQFQVTTQTYENGGYSTYVDEFNLFAGRHQLLFHVEYPIKLFKIKY